MSKKNNENLDENTAYSWIGRRWWEFRTGYITYMAFMFGFANFLLILYGLTDFFKDIPFIWFTLMMILVILPVATVIGYKHNKLQIRVEQKVMQHRHPYNNRIVPHSKEVLTIKFNLMILELLAENIKDEKKLEEITRFRNALQKFLEGELATDVIENEKI